MMNKCYAASFAYDSHKPYYVENPRKVYEFEDRGTRDEFIETMNHKGSNVNGVCRAINIVEASYFERFESPIAVRKVDNSWLFCPATGAVTESMAS